MLRQVASKLVASVATIVLLGSLSGCSIEGSDGAPAQQSQDIIEGTVAHGHQEAVLINMMDEYGPAGTCSGALVAPTVVLTAGHCVDGIRAWGIVAPFAGGQWTRATRGHVYDWDQGQHTFSYERHDVAVILLDEPIVVDRYATISDSKTPHGTEVTIVGRTKNGFASDDYLFESSPVVMVHEFASMKPARYYVIPEKKIQSGDSGGPVYRADGDDLEIVAVVSTGHLVFRIDLLHDWVQAFIDASPMPEPQPEPEPQPDGEPT